MKYQDAILLLIRMCLGFLFIYAAYSKILQPHEFAESIQNYQVFGMTLSRWIAVYVPFLELVLGLMLIFKFRLNEALILTVLLYIVFDLMILQAYFRGLDVNCGCFNPSDSTSIGISKLLENAVLTSAAVAAWYLRNRKYIPMENAK